MILWVKSHLLGAEDVTSRSLQQAKQVPRKKLSRSLYSQLGTKLCGTRPQIAAVAILTALAMAVIRIFTVTRDVIIVLVILQLET